MAKRSVRVFKVWWSELPLLSFFVLSGFASIPLSQAMPFSRVTGELITIGSTQIILTLPTFWLAPFFTLLIGIYRLYNVKYIIDTHGLECTTGILSFNLRVLRVRYEDIRLIETKQSLLDRFLDIGIVEIGTAATGTTDAMFVGVQRPKRIQDLIQAERDRRLKRVSLEETPLSPSAAAQATAPEISEGDPQHILTSQDSATSAMEALSDETEAPEPSPTAIATESKMNQEGRRS